MLFLLNLVLVSLGILNSLYLGQRCFAEFYGFSINFNLIIAFLFCIMCLSSLFFGLEVKNKLVQNFIANLITLVNFLAVLFTTFVALKIYFASNTLVFENMEIRIIKTFWTGEELERILSQLENRLRIFLPSDERESVLVSCKTPEDLKNSLLAWKEKMKPSTLQNMLQSFAYFLGIEKINVVQIGLALAGLASIYSFVRTYLMNSTFNQINEELSSNNHVLLEHQAVQVSLATANTQIVENLDRMNSVLQLNNLKTVQIHNVLNMLIAFLGSNFYGIMEPSTIIPSNFSNKVQFVEHLQNQLLKMEALLRDQVIHSETESSSISTSTAFPGTGRVLGKK